MVMKPTNAHECVKVPYVKNIVLVRASTTLVAILREVPTKDGYMEILQKYVNRCTDVKCK